jgi:GTP-binding protein HflX
LHNLPHNLIEAFKATLEEVVESDILVHVLDVSHPRVYQHSKAVLEVLIQLQSENKPIVTALNKIDKTDDKTWLGKLNEDFPYSVLISAKLKQNIDGLLNEIQKNLSGRLKTLEIKIPHTRMDLVNFFYREGKVIEIKYLQKAIKVKVNLPKLTAQKIIRDKDVETL